MATDERIPMGPQELARWHVLKLVLAGPLTRLQAAERVNLSYRQVKRLTAAVAKGGAAALLHGHRGQPSPRRLPEPLRARVLERALGLYADCHDRHCGELLGERDDLTVSRETVRRLRRAAGLAPTRTRRPPRHRRRRPRRAARGRLMLWDGSPHAWFGPAHPPCTLMAAVDDATGELLAACFTPAESSVAYLRLLHTIVTTHGLPVAVYQDRHSALLRTEPRRTLAEPFAGAPQPTQVGAALKALGIEAIFALSPQAKGRIERAFGTLQDRLVAELALDGLHTLEAANAWLTTTFQPRDNARFAQPAQDVTPAFRPVPRGLDLARVLSLAYAATVGHDHTVRLGPTVVLDIPPGPRGRRYAKARVEVRHLLDGTWRVDDHDRLIATAPATGPLDGPRPSRRRWHPDHPADTPAPCRQPGDIFMWPVGGQIDVV